MMTQKPLRVLIVDDQESIREFLQRLLEKIGHTIVGKASNGAEAVELAESLDPDVILMDIEMPKMNGMEATKRIMNRLQGPLFFSRRMMNPLWSVRQAKRALAHTC